ncbi:hypothetical protein, partial [Scytonema sp. HK-05]|uniref:hypothetical protein n=1 Tax=Scytonema sp. HK-05 TaxID=1137095 RepID=UPI001E3A1FCE
LADGANDRALFLNQLSVITYQLSVISYQLSVISYHLSVISYHLSVLTAVALRDALTATNALWSNWWGTRDHSYLTDNCVGSCSLLIYRAFL